MKREEKKGGGGGGGNGYGTLQIDEPLSCYNRRGGGGGWGGGGGGRLSHIIGLITINAPTCCKGCKTIKKLYQDGIVPFN